jgi:hypothetical protein
VYRRKIYNLCMILFLKRANGWPYHLLEILCGKTISQRYLSQFLQACNQGANRLQWMVAGEAIVILLTF